MVFIINYIQQFKMIMLYILPRSKDRAGPNELHSMLFISLVHPNNMDPNSTQFISATVHYT